MTPVTFSPIQLPRLGWFGLVTTDWPGCTVTLWIKGIQIASPVTQKIANMGMQRIISLTNCAYKIAKILGRNIYVYQQC